MHVLLDLLMQVVQILMVLDIERHLGSAVRVRDIGQDWREEMVVVVQKCGMVGVIMKVMLKRMERGVMVWMLDLVVVVEVVVVELVVVVGVQGMMWVWGVGRVGKDPASSRVPDT